MTTRVCFPDMHRRLPKSFAKSLEGYGDLLLLGHSFSDTVSYGDKWSAEEIKNNEYMSDTTNIKAIEKEEFFDNPPDILFISCYENQVDILNNIWLKEEKIRQKTALVHYAGNTNVPYEWRFVEALVTTDLQTFENSKRNNKKSLLFFPWVDFEEYSFQGYNDSNNINSYIALYDKLFPQAYNMAINIKSKFINYNFTFHQNLENNKLVETMKNSIATMHLKPLEGYGFSIIESLATGRPLIMYEPYSSGKTYNFWCIKDKNCIMFNSLEELQKKMERLAIDKDYRHELQLNSSKIVREKIDLNFHKNNLIKFFENIRK